LFTQFPFAEVDIEEISAAVSSVFNTNLSDKEEEILKLQCDIPLKARAPKKNLWNLQRTVPRLAISSSSLDRIFCINLPL